jgi:drug/metabolite transporter (DMT)-like permease
MLALVLPKKLFPVDKNAIVPGVVTAIGFGLGCALLYIALPHLRPGKIAFLISLEVLTVPLILWIINRSKPSKSELISLVPAIIGLWFLTGEKGLPTWYDFLALLSAVAYSIYTISLSHYSNRASVLQRSWITLSAIGIGASIISILTEDLSSIVWDTGIVVGVIYLTLVGSVLRFILQGFGQKFVSASFTALMFTAEPVFTIALSSYFLNEKFSNIQTIGASLILLALILANFKLADKST